MIISVTNTYYLIAEYDEKVDITARFVVCTERKGVSGIAARLAGRPTGSTLVQRSFSTRSALVQHSFSTRSALVQHSFNTRSTLVQHSFNTRSTLVQHSLNTRPTLVFGSTPGHYRRNSAQRSISWKARRDLSACAQTEE